MIPKIIWQTYKDPFDRLPDYAKIAAQTWIDMNPDYEYRYMDDLEASQFVLSHYGKEWYDLFINCPVGVMRGDIWRYMIINSYGGFYVDLDSICSKPLNSWIDNRYDLVLCITDDNTNFVQYAFAGSPNNKVLDTVINNVKNNIIKADYKNEKFVHKATGETVWSNSIKEFLGINDISYNNDLVKNFNMVEPIFIKNNIFCYKDWNDFHNGGFMKHLVGHTYWNDGNYIMWEEEAKIYMGKNIE